MQVNLSTVDDFISEMEDEKAIENGIVRCDVQVEPKSDGVDNYFIKAGFRSNGELRILSCHCGESPVGRKELPETDGKLVSLDAVERIGRAASRLQLTFRRGAFLA